MFNFIKYYVEYYKHRESPDSFWFWSALGCLSAAMRSNVYLEIPGEYILPNMYIILLADSAIHRKGAPCKALIGLLRELNNTKIIEGRASAQAVIRELGQTSTDEKGHMVTGASGVVYSEELSAAFVQDPATVPLLIELYDYHDKWNSSLATAAKVELTDVCLSLFTASNTALLKHIYHTDAKEGGLLGRTFVVRATNKRPRKSLFILSKIVNLDKQPLNEHLKKISKLKGPIKVSENAETIYDDWYHNIPEKIFEDRIGFGGRLGTHVFKVALALGAAREDFNMVLHEEDIREAIEICMKLRKNYAQLVMGMGSATQSQQISLIIQHLFNARNNQLNRAKLMEITLGDIDATDFDPIMDYLESAELVRTKMVGSNVTYYLTKRALEILSEED